MKGFTYKSYNFVNKDPVIDKVRTMIEKSGLTYQEIEDSSGVTSQTLRNWFGGETRRPQFATVAAVTAACGFELQMRAMDGSGKAVAIRSPFKIVKNWPAKARGESVKDWGRQARH